MMEPSGQEAPPPTVFSVTPEGRPRVLLDLPEDSKKILRVSWQKK